MKDYYIIIVAIFVLICSCIVSYRAGYDAGYANGPVKYFECVNGQCVEIPQPTERGH